MDMNSGQSYKDSFRLQQFCCNQQLMQFIAVKIERTLKEAEDGQLKSRNIGWEP